MIDISDKVMQAIELLEMMTEEEAVSWLEDYLEEDDAFVADNCDSV